MASPSRSRRACLAGGRTNSQGNPREPHRASVFADARTETEVGLRRQTLVRSLIREWKIDRPSPSSSCSRPVSNHLTIVHHAAPPVR